MPGIYSRRGRLDQRARDVLDEEQERSESATGNVTESRNRYFSALGGFDPQKYAAQTGAALTTDAIEALDSADEQNRRYANRSGVLHGGSRHAARLDLRKRLGRGLAGLGMQTGGLELRRIGGLGDVASMDIGREASSRNRYMDFLSGERDRQTAEENARRMAEAQERPWWQDLLETGGKVAAAFV